MKSIQIAKRKKMQKRVTQFHWIDKKKCMCNIEIYKYQQYVKFEQLEF